MLYSVPKFLKVTLISFPSWGRGKGVPGGGGGGGGDGGGGWMGEGGRGGAGM